MSSLFIGRFQPLHTGHLSVIEQYPDLVIGIGSSQYSGTPDNPLTAAERRQCLEQVTSAPIVDLPDIHDDRRWVEHILKIVYTVTPRIDLVVSGNALVQSLCRQAGLTVRPITSTIAIDGTTLRQLIRSHNPVWKQYVPSAIQSTVEGPILETGKERGHSGA